MTHAEAVGRISRSGIVGACHGDLARVKAIIKADPRLVDAMNSVDASAVDETPQGAAAHTQSREIVDYLREQKVRPDIFMAAAMGNADEVASFLRDDPALSQACGSHGIPLIAHAADNATAEAMLRSGVDCNIVMAVAFGLAEQVAALLKSDPSLAHVHSNHGVPLVQTACATGNKDVVKALLSGGADDPENAGKHFLSGGEVSDQHWAGHYFHNLNLHAAAFNNVGLSRATFHNINMAGALLININLTNANIEFATIDGLKIFGVEVQPLVEAELKRRAAAGAAT